MKAAECRKLALERSADEIDTAIAHLSEERDPPFPVGGADHGEQLTHALLAKRIRERIDGGEDPKDAFRAVMGEVRAVVSND